MSDSMQPHRRQFTRLRRPWDSPGKSTEVSAIAFSDKLSLHLLKQTVILSFGFVLLTNG